MYSNNVLICVLFNLQLYVVTYQINFMDDTKENVHVSCDNDDHCRGFGFEGFKCFENLCRCVDNKNCQKNYIEAHVTKIGKFCKLSAECKVESSYCNRGKCECFNKTIPSSDRRRCLKAAQLGSPCEESSQCVQINASCIDNHCICPRHTHSTNGMCYKSVAIGSACRTNEECAITEFSHCWNNKCRCNTEYIYSKKYLKCLLKAHNTNSECFENDQCSSTLGFGSECYQGLCKCKEIYNYKKSLNKCVLDALLGNECGNHSECHQISNDESRLECLLGICKCKLPYIEQYGYCIKNSGWTWTSFTLPDILPFVFIYAFFYVIR